MLNAFYVCFLLPACQVMASSSEERSRSGRRSPERRSRTRSRRESAEDAEPKEDGATSDRKTEKREEDHKGRPEQDSWSKASQSKRSKARGGGVRKNQRYPGQPGTWTCPDCERIVDKNDVSVRQHRRSSYCVRWQLWNGRVETDWKRCIEMGDRVQADPDLEVHNGQVWRRRHDPPKSPLRRRPTAECHEEETRGRSRSKEKERRSVSRGGRNRRLRLRERSESHDRRRRPTSRGGREGAKRETEAPAAKRGRDDSVSKKHTAVAAEDSKQAKKQQESSKVKKPEGKEPASTEESKAPAKKDEDCSSYSYYSSSSDGPEAEGDVPAESAKPAVAAPSQPKESSKASTASAAQKKKTAEAAAAPQGSSAAATDTHARHMAMMNSLMKTAMQTACEYYK